MRGKTIIVLLVVLLSGMAFYYLNDPTGRVIQQQCSVLRIIDGDTIECADGEKVRLLGINTPEKKQPFHDEAEQALVMLVANRTVSLELIAGNEMDKYGRTLAYIFSGSKFVNKELLAKGMANLYVYGTDKYTAELLETEKSAQDRELGLWKHSPNFLCVDLMNLKYEEDGERCTGREQLVLDNKCDLMDVIIKDSANHIYSESLPAGQFVRNYSCIWNDDGDTLMIRDAEGLILFYRY